MPSQGLDLDRLQSDLRLTIKVKLQQLATNQPQPTAGSAPSPSATPPNDPASQGPATVSTPTNAANLRKDTEAAAQAGTNHTDHEATPIDHAIRQAEAAAVTEGGNLLVNGKA